MRDRRAIPPLMKMLDDPNEWVMGAAADALAQFNDPAMVPALLAHTDRLPADYGSSPAQWALVKMDERATKPLIAALYGEDWKKAKAAADTLLERGDTRAVSALLDAIYDTESPVIPALIHFNKPLTDRRWKP